ncbi:c-type cytochrome [Lentisphaera profundi]|uniref:C-type cytochrome n=1 Tax=Lentisphaera profundi TaxID=1658616 RepID=A0ABY7W571_9BACT|nr:c-type cytochrome [Lentisphaera profundi]WDE99403.1 c-type cytochrome [Lentisphaera profundi]
MNKKDLSSADQVSASKKGGRFLAVMCQALFFCQLSASPSTPASEINIKEDFKVELLYSVPRSQGTWVAMTFDDKGRLYTHTERQQLFRITPPGLGKKEALKVEPIKVDWRVKSGRGSVQGMAFINKKLYMVRNGNHAKENYVPDSIVRLSDSNNDEQLDKLEYLFDIPSVPGEQAPWNEHGMHAIVAGPDGKSIYVVSGDRNPLPAKKGLAPPHWNQDAWGKQYLKDPYVGGWVMRADLEGKNVEYFSVGLRNCYDIAFNSHGDLFTYDSDLEFDIALPQYRPTAIRHVMSGVDAGWGGRGGHMNKSFNSDFEEIQAPIKNIGPGSPTGVAFAYGAKFPAKYQRAFYACDWSYGRLFAVHLSPDGATYKAEIETFLSAQGLPIVDLAVSPLDGALYFTVGGRGTQSSLYRVTYTGDEKCAPVQALPLDKQSTERRQARLKLEKFHGQVNPKIVAQVWSSLADEDRSTRSAARIALEWQKLEQWKGKALTEANVRIKLQALIALARCTDGQKSVQAELINALNSLKFGSLSADEKTWYLRVLTLSHIRHGKYSPNEAKKIIAKFEAQLPDKDRRVNLAIVTMLSHLGSRQMIKPSLDLLKKSRTQEEQVVYTESLLRIPKATWSLEQGEALFKIAAESTRQWKGGARVKSYRERTLKGMVNILSEEQKQLFAKEIAALKKPSTLLTGKGRSFVKNWKIKDLAGSLEEGLKQKRDLANGRALYAETACITCHNFNGEGGLAGPDLSSVGGQYNAHDLLENILSPSKVINEQYGLMIYNMKDGTSLQGRTINMVGNELMVASNPLDPGSSELRLSKDKIKNISASTHSFMPPGLLNSLSQEDILDLLAYLLQ